MRDSKIYSYFIMKQDQNKKTEPTDFITDNSTPEELHATRAVKPKNDVNRYTARCFHLTIHGQKLEDFNALKSFFDAESWTKRSLLGPDAYIYSDDEANKENAVTLAVIAKEFGKFKIHPHWQVYFELKTRTGMMSILETLLGHSNFHLEKAKSTSSASIAYVYAVDKIHEAGFVVYNKAAPVPLRYDPTPSAFWGNFVPRSFQASLLALTTAHPNRRKILYIHEPIGNTGKSILVEYLHIFHGAIVTGGSSADMKYAIERWSQITGAFPIFICVDVARSQVLTRETYKAIEDIKNGLFFTGKYESTMTHSFVKPHVLIFANVPPVREYFSEDRWLVYTINEAYELVKESSF